MRILLVSTHYLSSPGGVQIAVDRLIHYLVDHGHDVALLTSLPPGQFRCRVEKRPGFEILSAMLRVPQSTWKARTKLAFPFMGIYALLHLGMLIRRRPPDVINLHFANAAAPYAIALAKLLRIPLVVSLHGSDVFIFSRQKTIHRRFLPMSIAQADTIIANSPAMLKHLHRDYPDQASQAAYVPNGLDPRAIEAVAPAAYPWPYILTVSRLVALKAVDVVIQAFARLRVTHKDYRLMIAGDGPERSSLQALVQSLDLQAAVVFLGSRPHHEIPSLMAGCDVFVLASRSESFGIVLLEAMAAARPIVATSVGGIPDVVVDGDSGILVPPDNPGQLAQALSTLIADPDLRQAFGESGYRRVRSQFTMESVGAAYVQLYQNTIRRYTA